MRDSYGRYWEEETCGARYALEKIDSNIDYDRQLIERYKLEEYIKPFARFEDNKNLDVLEIGVGLGADHQMLATSCPKSLTGVDLSQQALDHTARRLKIKGLRSELKIEDATNLSFGDSSFDSVYSFGVLHHTKNLELAVSELHRVLRPGGTAKVMIYHKWAPVGLMLWIRYALLRLRPFTSLAFIYRNHLESYGTRACSLREAREIFKAFNEVNIKVTLSHGDLLLGQVGKRHQGAMLKILKRVYPRWVLKQISRLLPFGLFLLISLRK